MSSLTKTLAVARGDHPADLLLKNGRVINVYSGTIDDLSIAIHDSVIAGLGNEYEAEQVVDLGGAYVAPGLIDAHVHVESSLCLPAQFASALLPRGVTCAITDPHEIANVAGVEGIRFMAASSRDLPLTVITMAPSCVPASHMETNGAHLDDEELLPLLIDGTVYGLAEVMNFPGVINGTEEVIAKLAAFQDRPLDGHAPGLRGKMLNAYAAAGIGSEHECTTVEEAAEKLARGFYILIREATNARNLHALLPLVTPQNSRRICFCTDDRIPGDLLDQGSIDHMVREAITFGIDPVTAIRMATLNSAELFGLSKHGGIAPGKYADLFLFEDLTSPTAHQVYAKGRLVAADGDICSPVCSDQVEIPQNLLRTVKVNPAQVNLQISAPTRADSDNPPQIRVIGIIEDQLITDERLLRAKIADGMVVSDPARDILKMAVVERHTTKALNQMNQTGLGFIQGLGLNRGALAGTVAHDHHNLVVIGADDRSMMAALSRVVALEGGLAVADGDAILAELALPVAGLMSDESIQIVRGKYDKVRMAAHQLGSTIYDPFMAMSFMALEVIPKLKLTDQGLVDVEQFAFVNLFVEQ